MQSQVREKISFHPMCALSLHNIKFQNGLGWKGLGLVFSPSSSTGRDTLCYPRLLQAPSNLALGTSGTQGQPQLPWEFCLSPSPPSQLGIPSIHPCSLAVEAIPCVLSLHALSPVSFQLPTPGVFPVGCE